MVNIFWKEVDIWLVEVKDFDFWSEVEKELLKMGVMVMVDVYVSVKQVDKVKVLLNKVKQWYEENEDYKVDEEFMVKYDFIVN